MGRNKHYHEEWISIATLGVVHEMKNRKTTINNSRTRTEKVKAQAECTEANKQLKKSIRADIQKCVENPAVTAKKAATEEIVKQLYDTTKKLVDRYSKPQ
ncbi:unnamed protein product [Schistosoma curassoni]|uniref:Uncharacterized protein n=1 Tax=Schistosoma curassoni TaxID=6186 RepID=A0A183L5C5_9TREM|nr:unnamed protein product [Schistosoma curassoni]